jgi:aromatic ring hydroxylase
LSDPALGGSLAGMAGYFDWQHRYAEDCLVHNPAIDAVTNASLLLPRSADDLDKRHRSFERLARYSYGMLGRTPDYVQTVLSGFAARDDGFIVNGDRVFADRVIDYHKEVARRDLSLTHAIILPAIDKSMSPVAGVNGEIALQVTERKSDRLVVSGVRRRDIRLPGPPAATELARNICDCVRDPDRNARCARRLPRPYRHRWNG